MSNDNRELIDQVALEIALGQSATAAVDAAAAEILGVNSTDLRALGRLNAAGALTAGELARRTGVSKGAMTTALDRLERAGYVSRVRGDQDRRQVRVEVTAHAASILAAIWGPIAEAGKAQLAGYDASELTFLVEFLRRGRELQEREAARIREMADAERKSPSASGHAT